MAYVIHDSNNELIDVIDFETPEDLELYEQLNPNFTVRKANTEDFLILEEDTTDEDEDIYSKVDFFE